MTADGPVAYAGVDPNYALGPETWLPRYSVACRHETAALRLMEQRGVEVFCLARHLGDGPLPGRATAALLAHPKATQWLERRGDGLSLLVFKPNAQVEQAADAHGWRILGARAAVARPIENKLQFARLLEERGLPRPQWREIHPAVDTYADVAAALGPRLVIQAAHGFSGNRSFIVDDEATFAQVTAQLRNRRARASRRVEGSPMTMNACVLDTERVRTGPLFHQVTGAPGCTPYPLGACGNDWTSCPPPPEVVVRAAAVARAVGQMLAERGFRGIFGLDFVVTASGEIVTIECNPRIVSSVPMATALEQEAGALPLLASHLQATRGLEADDAPDIREGIRGAQLVLHTLTATPTRVRAALDAGRYRLDEGRLAFVAPALKPTECADDDEFVVLPPAPGHVLQAASECARVQMRGGLLEFPDGVGGGLGVLTPRAQAIARAVQTALELEPCTEEDDADEA